jgi:mitofusin
LADGFPERYSEFEDFERKFEQCILKSAVRTKFERHSESGKRIVLEIRPIIDGIYFEAEQLKKKKADAMNEIHRKLEQTKEQLSCLPQEKEDKIQQIVADVEPMVSCFRGTSVSCINGRQR